MARSSTAKAKTAVSLQRAAKPRVGRPTAERVEAIESQILDAARAHFLESGFEQTSIESIALTAGVSKGTLYARYTNKTALLRAIYERDSAAWLAKQQHDLGSVPEEFGDRLRYYARRIIGTLGSEDVRSFRQLVRRAGAPDIEMVRVFFEVGYTPSIEELAEEFERGAHKMGLKPRNPRRAAEMFMSSLLGWHAIHEFRGVESTPPQEAAFADDLIAVVLAGAAAW
jgi:TetR/AcrR family transcriptional repressor of mexJK operon